MRLPRPIIWTTLVAILLIQALAYFYVLPLSLGPRVILQPWLMRQGYLLYEHIADEHMPLMYLLITVLQPLIPDGLVLAKTVLVSLISLSALLTFWAAKSARGDVTGLCAMLFFTIWSPVFGFGKLWHETFLTPIYILTVLMWRSSLLEVKRTLITGLLLGLAALLKQHALAVILAVFLHRFLGWWHQRYPLRYLLLNMGLFAAGICTPLILFMLYHRITAGTLQDFLFWVISFSTINKYAQLAALSPSVAQLRILAPAYFLVIPFVLSLRQKDHKLNQELWVFLLLLVSHVTAYPRFGFFHLQPVLPVLAWISAIVTNRLLWSIRNGCTEERLISKGIVLSAFLFSLLYGGFSYWTSFFDKQPQKIYEYTDLLPLYEGIRQHIKPDERVYIFPDDEGTANLYYLLKSPPPKIWSPTSYPWFTIAELKPVLIETFQQWNPEWVIYFPERWGAEQHAWEILLIMQNRCHLTEKFFWAEGEVHLLRCESP